MTEHCGVLVDDGSWLGGSEPVMMTECGLPIRQREDGECAICKGSEAYCVLDDAESNYEAVALLADGAWKPLPRDAS